MSVWLSTDSIIFYSLMPEPFFSQQKIVTLQTGSLPVGFCSHISSKWCSWDKEILEGRSEPEAKAADWGLLLEPSWARMHGMGLSTFVLLLVCLCSMLLGGEEKKLRKTLGNREKHQSVVRNSR